MSLLLALQGITATLTQTEQNDSLTATAVLAIQATLVITEAEDTLSSTAVLAIQVTLNATEAGDVLSSSASLAIQASFTIIEAGDTLSSTASFLVEAVVKKRYRDMVLDPPPSKVELASKPQPDYIWKAWIYSLYEYVNREKWNEIGSSGAPAFQNSWVNNGGANDETAAFRARFNDLYLKGLIRTGAIADGTVIFTLPGAYWPRKTIKVTGMFVQGLVESAYQIEIQTDGDVAIYGVSGASPILSIHAIVCLDN